MVRSLFAFLLVLGLVAPAWSQNKPAAGSGSGDPVAESPALAKVKENPGDVAAWNAYATEQFSQIAKLTQSNPAAALKQLEAFESSLGAVEPTSDAAKTLVARMKSAVTVHRNNIEVAQVSVEDLEKKIAANPDDAKSITLLAAKLGSEVGDIARSAPEKAEAQLQALKDRFAKLKEAAKEDAAKTAVDKAIAGLGRYDSAIASGKKLNAMVGKDAAPLAVEAWVNGKPLTDGDLKGKVVLLDFWAVWCGPCIATFPHLRDWQEEYGDKGLVIIGLTNYYKYKWDDETKRQKSDKEASKEDEQAMLVKFAEMHSLKHRFALQDGKSMAEYYGVTGIPQAVVIDQQGKVQLVRIGSGDANAKDISNMLKKLLADKPTSK